MGRREVRRAARYVAAAVSEGDAGRDGGSEPRAAAGWYPDPQGSGNMLYWDGEKWTGDVHAPSPAAQPQRRRETSVRLMIGGGVALAISPLLPWVKVVLLGNLSLFQLFDAAGRSDGWAWIAVIAGLTAAVLAFREGKPTTVWRVALGVGLLGGALALYALVVLRDEVSEASGLATVGIGPYVAVAGCVAMVIGALKARAREAAAR